MTRQNVRTYIVLLRPGDLLVVIRMGSLEREREVFVEGVLWLFGVGFWGRGGVGGEQV
jgi:hypothetical protein